MTMTPEEMQESLTKALASISKLETKNKELLEEKKKATSEADAAREAAEQAADEKAREGKNVEELEKRLNARFEKEKADLIKQNAEKDSRLQALLIDNGIATALVENKIAPEYHEVVTALFKSQAKLENGEAMIGDAALAESIKAYATSDKGKHFVTAPVNGGAGATGSKATGSALTKENMTLDKILAMAATNPAEANAALDAIGMGHLKSA